MKQIKEDEMIDEIHKLKVGDAHRRDSITPEMITYIGQEAPAELSAIMIEVVRLKKVPKDRMNE